MAQDKTPPKWAVLFFTIVATVGAVLCVIWFVRVWRGDNPTDTTVLLLLSLLTVASGAFAAVGAKKRGS
jgi:drug/metabolite transporter (DMT)-like permease